MEPICEFGKVCYPTIIDKSVQKAISTSSSLPWCLLLFLPSQLTTHTYLWYIRSKYAQPHVPTPSLRLQEPEEIDPASSILQLYIHLALDIHRRCPTDLSGSRRDVHSCRLEYIHPPRQKKSDWLRCGRTRFSKEQQRRGRGRKVRISRRFRAPFSPLAY